MPKKLTQDKIKQLEENANMMMANGSSEEEILSMSNQFMEQFGVEDTIEKKKPSPIQPQSQSVLSQATNGLFGGSQLPQENTQTEQSSGQSSTRGISLLRGKSVKPIEAQQGKVEEKKRGKQDVISYASNKLANVFARGDEGIKQELIPNIEKELQSGNHGDVYDYFETKKVDDDFVKNASPTDIVQSANSKADALKNSPQELAVYETTKESKIANHILDIQNGNKLGERDKEYFKQNAPSAYKQVLNDVQQFNTDFPIQDINTVAEINKKKVDANSQIQGAKNIQQSVQAFSGIIPEDMLGMGVINSKLKGVKDTYANELKKLEEQYPIETYTVKTSDGFDTRAKERPREYFEAKQELEQKRDELLGKAGVLESVYYGKKNPNVNDVELGKKFVEVQSPTMYSLYKTAVSSKGFEADLAKMGIDVMINSGDPNLIAKGKEYERTFNDRYPEFAERDLQRKIGIEYFKKEGVNTISNPNAISVREADKLIDQFSDKEMKVYSKMKDRLMKESGFAGDKANWAKIPIPNAGGLVNSLVEGAFMPIAGTYNLLANISETDQQKAQRVLTPQSIASEKVFEKDQINREIESLLKKDKLNIIDAKKLSELYTEQSLKTDAQRFGDASLLVAGQVLSQGGFGRLLGAGTSTLVGGSASALKGLGYIAKAERVAELANNMNAMSNFGNATFSFLSTYDDASLEIERLSPNASNLFKNAYATSVGLLNAGTEHIFQDVRIFDAFRREVAPGIASLVTNLSTRSITEEVFRREVSNILKNRIPKYLGNVVKENVKEDIEEATTEAGTLVTKLAGVALGEIDPSQVNIDEGIEAIGQVFKQTAMDGLLVSLISARGESLRSRTTQRALYELATNQQQLDGFIDAVNIQQQQNKMSVEDATDKIKTARTLNEVATKIIPALEKRITLNDNQKIALTSLLTLEKKLENDLSNPQNSGIKSVIESQLADVRNKKEGILKGEYIVDENFNALTPEELKQKVQEEKESDEELKKSISKVNTNPSFVIIEETDGTFSVLIDNEKKEEGFKTKEEASQRVLKLNGIQFDTPTKSTRKVTEKDGVTIEMPYNKITEEGGVSYEEPSTTTPNKVVEKDGIAIELPPSQEDLQTTQNTPQNEPLKGKDKVKDYVSSLTDDNYLFTHVTTEDNAKSITENGMSVSLGTGISSTLTASGKESATNQVERLMNGEIVHRNLENNSVAIISVPKSELDKMSGKTLDEKFENWLVENNHINEKGQLAIPKEFNAGYLSGDTFIQNSKKQNESTQETIEATNTETSTNIGQQPSNAPIQEENTEDVTQSEIGIHESTKGVMNGMNVTIERKDDGNYIYTMLGDKIPFTKEQHDELVVSKELIITKGKEVPKTQTPEVKAEQQPTTSTEFTESVRKQVADFHEGIDHQKTKIEAKENRLGKFNPMLSNGKSDYILAGVQFDTKEEANSYIENVLAPNLKQLEQTTTSSESEIEKRRQEELELFSFENKGQTKASFKSDEAEISFNINPDGKTYSLKVGIKNNRSSTGYLYSEALSDTEISNRGDALELLDIALNKVKEKINTKYDTELKSQNEGKGTKEIPSEPIQPKGSSKGKDKEGVGEAVQQGSKGTDNAVTGTTTSVLETPKIEEGSRNIKSVDEYVEPKEQDIKDGNTFELIRGNVYDSKGGVGQTKNIQGIGLGDAMPSIFGDGLMQRSIKESESIISKSTDRLKVVEAEIERLGNKDDRTTKEFQELEKLFKEKKSLKNDLETQTKRVADYNKEKSEQDKIDKENSDLGLVWLTNQKETARSYAEQLSKVPKSIIGERGDPKVNYDVVKVTPKKIFDLTKLTDENGSLYENGAKLEEIENLLGIKLESLPDNPEYAYQLFRGRNAKKVVELLKEKGYDVVRLKEGNQDNFVLLNKGKAVEKSLKEQPKAETPKQNIKQNEKQQSKPKGTDVTKQQTPNTETSGDNQEGGGNVTLKEDRRGKTPKSKRKIKNPTLLSALKVDTAGNPYWHVLQYFINKGNYSAELLTEIYGKAKRGGNDLSGKKTILPEGEKRARIEFLNKKSFKTVDSLAEWLSEGYLSENMIMDADDTNDSRAFRELVEDAINSFGSRMEMADYLLEQANQEPDYYIDEYDEIQKEYGGFTDDAIDYLSNLSDEQLLELDKDMDAFFEANPIEVGTELDIVESDTDISKSITKLSELSNKIDNAQTTSEARKAKEDYDNELKKDSKLNFIITNFTSITDQLEKLKLITKKGDC